MKDLLKDHPWADRLPLPEWLKKPLVRFYDRFVKLQGQPERLARGLALGIFIGFTPTMGIQMPIALVVAALLRQSKIAAVIGVWISNPVTAPFLYGFTYVLGAKVLGMEVTQALRIPETWAELKMLSFEMFLPLWVGGVLAGAAAFFPTYYFGIEAIKGYRAARRKIKERRERKAGGPHEPEGSEDPAGDEE